MVSTKKKNRARNAKRRAGRDKPPNHKTKTAEARQAFNGLLGFVGVPYFGAIRYDTQRIIADQITSMAAKHGFIVPRSVQKRIRVDDYE